MTAQQLRNSILQQAIQGRLVPQDPNDEPASVLLERIRKEKEQLVKEGKLKKKDLVIYSLPDNLPFDLPDSWEWVSLSEIVAIPIKRGKSPVYVSNSEYLAFAQKCNTKKGQIDLTLALYIDEAKATSYSDDLFLKKGDIVINSTGGGTMGRVGYFDEDYPSSIKGILPDSHVTTVRALHILPKYAYYYIKTCQQYLESCGEGGTNQTELKPVIIASLPIPLPPLAEQRRIVAKIEELMPLVEKYGKTQTELDTLNQDLPRRLRQSVLQQAIQGKLVSQDKSDGTGISLYENICKHKEILCKSGQLKSKDVEPSDVLDEEIPFDIPESWKWCHMGDLISMRMGKTPPRGDSQYWSNANLPWVSISDMKDYGHVKSTKEYVSQYAADHAFKEISPVGSLLMSFKLTVGRTSILEIPAYHNEAIITINPYVDDDYAFRNYLFYLLPVLANLGDSKDAIKGKTLNSTSLYNLLIPLPPLNEQKRIVAKIEELFAEIDKLK